MEIDMNGCDIILDIERAEVDPSKEFPAITQLGFSSVKSDNGSRPLRFVVYSNGKLMGGVDDYAMLELAIEIVESAGNPAIAEIMRGDLHNTQENKHITDDIKKFKMIQSRIGSKGCSCGKD